jgi:hypothetical protein
METALQIWNHNLPPYTVLLRVLVNNNAGSGLDERVYLLLIHSFIHIPVAPSGAWGMRETLRFTSVS